LSFPLQAQWIEPVEGSDVLDVQRPVYQLVGSFDLLEVATAELRITAHGIYEAFLNGVRVGDEELTPGFTSYRSRLQVQRFDVTAQLRAGENVLGVLLSDGWWRGQNTIGRRTNAYGETTALLAELTVTGADGAQVVLSTGPSWKFAPSHIEAADLIAGEVHDLRKRRDDWALPGADRAGWAPVRVADHGVDTLCEPVGPPVRRMQELPAVSVVEVRPGRHLVDFGQVSNGWVRLSDLGPKGTRLTMVHGECLSPEGDDVQIEALAGGVHTHDPRWEASFQTDVVVSAGDGSVFEPRHSTKGFRYVRIDGHPGPLEPSALTSVVVHTDVAPVGAFACSDDDLAWLHTAADWSLRTNLCEIPTDCPTRDRAGWTGDWQIYVDTASYLYDVTELSRKWLLDVVAEQLPSGAVLHFVPDPFDHVGQGGWWTDLQGSAGWGDAIAHVPWELYRATGRTDVLEPFVEAMRRWVDFAADRAATGRHPDRVAARPDPAEHEAYLWDTGFHFGEWNEPENAAFAGDPDVNVESGLPGLAARLMGMDHGPTATAFLYRSADELAQAARVLGDDQTASRYAALAAKVQRAWRTEFIDADGRVRPATQPNLVRALAFGLIPDELRQQAADELADLVRARGMHLGTGFLATPFLLPVLADHGHLDLAYEVLFQRSAPSWLAMRDQGATTIWEGWHPFDEGGKVKESLNHFSMGAVVGFLHRYVAGLQVVEPGYRRFRVAPRPGAGVSWVRTHHDSPHGRIEVAWKLDGDVGSLEVTVPEGTTAEVVLPGLAPESLEPGSHTLAWAVPALTRTGAVV
jgi:alpha-L-rhamnosidase